MISKQLLASIRCSCGWPLERVRCGPCSDANVYPTEHGGTVRLAGPPTAFVFCTRPGCGNFSSPVEDLRIARAVADLDLADADLGPQESPTSERCPLSARQLEVIGDVCEGVTANETARRLGLSASTVRQHISHVLGLLEVRTQTQAALIVRARGWA